jgi:hypothetical protein
MLITCTCPNDINTTRAVFSKNNNFLAVFSENFKLPPYSKICVHSAYISFAPLIQITTGLNDEVHFGFTVSTGSFTDTATISQGLYTPQQLALEVQRAINAEIDPATAEISVNVDWDVISGSYQFHIYFQQPSGGAVSLQRAFSLIWANNQQSLNLGRIMGFVGGANTPISGSSYTYGSTVVFNDTIPEMMMTIEGDYSVNYNTNANTTPVAYISIENINSKSWNNYSQQALKFLEVMRYSYAQNLNNTFILPYEKSWISLDNDNEIRLNELEITIRNIDGSLIQNLDTSKQTIVIFEIQEDLQRKFMIERIQSIQEARKQHQLNNDMMEYLLNSSVDTIDNQE